MPALLRPLLVAGLAFAAVTPIMADEKPVSFANEIAPILVDQCLICHNTRTSKGRFSVETYATLMKGGESGQAVDPGDGEFSNLVLLVESGDMPKDGDPLAAEQIEVLQRWISQGAALDDGKPADQPLRSIMPKPDHPSPPDVYPAPVSVTALAFAPDASLLAVSGYHEVLVFKPEDGSLVRRISNVAERVYAVEFSPDGQFLAVAAGTPARLGEVKLFRVETGELVADLASAADSFFDVAFSPDGAKIAAAGADRAVRVWNVADGAEVLRIEDHADWVTAVAFSADGARIATASHDKTAKVFDLKSSESISTFTEHEAPVHDVIFSTDGRHVASCGADGRVRFWEASSGKQSKSENLGGKGLSLTRASVDSVICGVSDRTAKLFGFDGDKQETYGGLPDWPAALASTSDGALIAIGTADGAVTIRRGADDDALQTFPAMPPKP
ncbi:MAG: c-type cytochrome domain-containing protein [Planctomycetaceae bacterium]